MPKTRPLPSDTAEASVPPPAKAPLARSRTRPVRASGLPAAGSTAPQPDPLPAQHCDFCGAEAATVRRVALDRDYDRLLTPHRELYACGPCSERKEGRRLGLQR
ncbi:hypothetical protein KJ059_18535 [Myxococcota bacterium]|nr:hypothetical protein [Myxococcota bacterium]MCZ7618444.1 hypothetical protein [Myxococcota bacterium]